MLTNVTHWAGGAARPFTPAGYSSLAHERLRFTTLSLIGLFKLLNFFGAVWDIQWHVSIGRDSLFIPPHMLAAGSFVGGLALSLAAISHESWLARRGVRLAGAWRLGGLVTTPAFLGVALAYMAATFFTFTDDLWHRAYGLDATLWSPPHLAIMLAMNTIDACLLLGMTAAARRLGQTLGPRSPYFWGFILAGAFTFESANFQLSEAFIVGYRYGGAGLWGLLFPILMGVWYPLWLAVIVRLARRFWMVLPIFGLTLLMQYTGTGLAQLGFAALQPVSVIDAFVRDNPGSAIALARDFAIRSGFTSLIGFQQAWVMWLSAAPLALVALLDVWPALRSRPLIAAPVYSAALVAACLIMFQGLPVMAAYDINAAHVGMALVLAVAEGWVMGKVGVRLAALAARW